MAALLALGIAYFYHALDSSQYHVRRVDGVEDSAGELPIRGARLKS
jgi:hypothetical protein